MNLMNIMGRSEEGREGQSLRQMQKNRSSELAQFLNKNALSFNYNYYSKYQKSMHSSPFKALTSIETSIDHQQCIKPCLKSQNISEKSTIVQENSNKLLNTCFLSHFREVQAQKDDDSQSEVSLEEDILEEHKMTLEQLFKTSSVFINRKKVISRCKQNEEHQDDAIFKQITLEHYLHVLFAKLKAIKPALVNLFNSYLHEDKTFYRFLQHVYYSYPNRIVHRVFKYLFYTWQLYYPCLHKRLSIKQAQNVAKKISDRMLRCQQNIKHSQMQFFDEFRSERIQMVEILAITVVLVMEKCFQNPHLNTFFRFKKQQIESNSQISEQAYAGRKMIKRDSESQSE